MLDDAGVVNELPAVRVNVVWYARQGAKGGVACYACVSVLHGQGAYVGGKGRNSGYKVYRGVRIEVGVTAGAPLQNLSTDLVRTRATLEATVARSQPESLLWFMLSQPPRRLVRLQL